MLKYSTKHTIIYEDILPMAIIYVQVWDFGLVQHVRVQIGSGVCRMVEECGGLGWFRI